MSAEVKENAVPQHMRQREAESKGNNDVITTCDLRLPAWLDIQAVAGGVGLCWRPWLPDQLEQSSGQLICLIPNISFVMIILKSFVSPLSVMFPHTREHSSGPLDGHGSAYLANKSAPYFRSCIRRVVRRSRSRPEVCPMTLRLAF